MKQKQIDQYKKAYNRDMYTCQVCGKPASQIAHRIANTKANRKLYGNDVIDCFINLVAVCSLECNSACNIGNKPVIADTVAKGIRLFIERLDRVKEK